MDYLIIGAGPAGLQLGYFMKRAGRDFRILEAGPAPGTFFRRYPRHRTMISSNKVHTGTQDPELNLRMDWNSLLTDDGKGGGFKHYSQKYFPPADSMVKYLEEFASDNVIPIDYDTRVARISREGSGKFRVLTSEGNSLLVRHIIVATGVSKPYVPEIPGIEEAENYDRVSVDPKDFTGQKVLILGKGNSAFETADNLIETTSAIHVAGPNSLRLAWRTHFVGHLRAVNNNFLDTYQLKSLNAIIDGEVEKIERHGQGYDVTIRFVRTDEVRKTIRYDRVIVCTGFRFDASIFDPTCRPKLAINNRFPAQTAEWESVNVPGLYFAGTLMQERDFKQSTSGFIHGFRYSVRSLHRVLEEKYENNVWPHSVHPCTPDDMADAIISRVNRTSGLWQQFGHLCDVLSVDQREFRYFEEMATDYVRLSEAVNRSSYFMVTLEYGADHEKIDPFDIKVGRVSQQDSENAADAHYLHPVIRYFSDGQLRGEHHLTENLDNEWDSEEVHVRPLRAWLSEIGETHISKREERFHGSSVSA